MGIFDAFKSNLTGNRAMRAHTSAQQYGKRGEDEKMEKEFKRARALYEQAIAENCEMPKVYMSYAILLMREDEPERAKEMLLKAESLPGLVDAQKVQLYTDYGICQWKLGNLDKAIELLRSAERRGKSGTIYTTLGHLLLEKAEQTGDFTEAEPYIQEAYEYDDEDPEGIDLMGQLLQAKGDLAGAKEYYERALKIKPDQGWTHAHLAQLAEVGGDLEGAKKHMEQALEGSFHLLSPISKKAAHAYAKKLGLDVDD